MRSSSPPLCLGLSHALLLDLAEDLLHSLHSLRIRDQAFRPLDDGFVFANVDLDHASLLLPVVLSEQDLPDSAQYAMRFDLIDQTVQILAQLLGVAHASSFLLSAIDFSVSAAT